MAQKMQIIGRGGGLSIYTCIYTYSYVILYIHVTGFNIEPKPDGSGFASIGFQARSQETLLTESPDSDSHEQRCLEFQSRGGCFTGWIQNLLDTPSPAQPCRIMRPSQASTACRAWLLGRQMLCCAQLQLEEPELRGTVRVAATVCFLLLFF